MFNSHVASRASGFFCNNSFHGRDRFQEYIFLSAARRHRARVGTEQKLSLARASFGLIFLGLKLTSVCLFLVSLPLSFSRPLSICEFALLRQGMSFLSADFMGRLADAPVA